MPTSVCLSQDSFLQISSQNGYGHEQRSNTMQGKDDNENNTMIEVDNQSIVGTGLCRSICYSGVKHDMFNGEELGAETTRTFGQSVGLLNYVIADRPDCCFMIRGLGRGTKTPIQERWQMAD